MEFLTQTFNHPIMWFCLAVLFIRLITNDWSTKVLSKEEIEKLEGQVSKALDCLAPKVLSKDEIERLVKMVNKK